MNKSGKALFGKAVAACVVTALLAVVGWQSYEGCVAHPPADMTKLAPAFPEASATLRDLIQHAVAAGNAKDYATAVEALAAIVDQEGVAEGQKHALIFTLSEIRRKVAEAAPADADLLGRIDELMLRLSF